MKTSKKITLLLVGAVVMSLLLTGLAWAFNPSKAEGVSRKVTVVWSPHPDDETLRLDSYVLTAKSRGDVLILVAVTDGGASGVKNKLGISASTMMAMRRAEQTKAWSAMTGGKGQIIRLGLPDGAVTRSSIYSAYDRVMVKARSYGLPIEHYVAASIYDAHPDHRQVAYGVMYKGYWTYKIVRFSLEPGAYGYGTRYVTWNQTAAEAAHQAYSQIGMISVPSLFKALHYNKHYSRITAPPVRR